jgi:branched-subunit amino acid aminotransferase/4-amino-4-deoxychorismate lyase
VYESIRLYNNRPFELPAHIDRLARSCEGIRMNLPLPKETLALLGPLMPDQVARFGTVDRVLSFAQRMVLTIRRET